MNEDLSAVVGLKVAAALGRLADVGMGYAEATEFLVGATADGLLILDPDGRFQPSSDGTGRSR